MLVGSLPPTRLLSCWKLQEVHGRLINRDYYSAYQFAVAGGFVIRLNLSDSGQGACAEKGEDRECFHDQSCSARYQN